MPLGLGVVENALRHVVPEVERTEFEEYDWATKFTPMDNRRMPGVQQIRYYRITHTGIWKLLSDYANVVEMSDVYMKSVDYEAAYYGAGIQYSNQEQDAIEFARNNTQNAIAIDMTREKMEANETGWMALKDRVFFRGQVGKRTYGMINHPDVPRYLAPYRLSIDTDPDDNVALLGAVTHDIVHTSKKRERPTTVILPGKVLDELKLQKFSDDGRMTTWQYFLANNGYITEGDSSYDLEGAGPNGGDLALFYTRDPRKVVGSIPKDKTQFGPPQYEGFVIKVLYDGQVAGVHYKRPLSARIVEFPPAA